MLMNGISQIGRFHELIKKLESNMMKLLRNLLTDLEKKCTDQDDAMYYDINNKLEKLNFNRSRERLAYDKEYLNLKNEQITSEFIRRMQDGAKKEAKLANIIDPSTNETLGKNHGDKISEMFNEKFKKRLDEPTEHKYDLRNFISAETLNILNSRKLTGEEKNALDGPIKLDELDKAIKIIKCSSSPGPDGLPAIFIRNLWKIIRSPLLETYNHHLSNNILPEDYCTARLKLIPKPGDGSALKNWRPITIY